MRHRTRTTQFVTRHAGRMALGTGALAVVLLAVVGVTELEMAKWVTAVFASLVGVTAAAYATHVGEQVRASVQSAFRAGVAAGHAGLTPEQPDTTVRHLHAVSE